MTNSAPLGSGRVLLVDDNDAVLNSLHAVLTRNGWTADVAHDGEEAKRLIQQRKFDVVVSDINMPVLAGLPFLREIRELDLDVPVILVTGAPTIDSSIQAIEYGVFRYLVKPVVNREFLDVVARAARFHKLAQLKRTALQLGGTDGKWLGDRAALENRFARGNDLMWMAYQPIVSWQDRRVFAYEALLRSDEPTLASPLELLEAAERLGKVHELGRAVRAKVAPVARELPEQTKLFVNLHASDLSDPSLRDPASPLSEIAERVVLEVTERASLETVAEVSVHVKTLKAMGFQIAIDDLGAGYAGLSSFTQLEPEIVKLDMSLVRDIDSHAKKQAIVESMTRLSHELEMSVVAEGVETSRERDRLIELGCDLLQGYLFARPQRGLQQPVWQTS